MAIFNKSDDNRLDKEGMLISALLELGVNQEHIDTVLRHKKMSKKPFINVIREVGFPESETVAEAMSLAFSRGYVDPISVQELSRADFPEMETLTYLSDKTICAVGYDKETKTIKVAISEESQISQAKDSFYTALPNYNIEINFASQETIENTYLKIFSNTKAEIDVILKKIEKNNEDSTIDVSKFMSLIVKHACFTGVSDIHFNPLHTTGMVKFRIDGDLKEFCALPREIFDRAVKTVKMSGNINGEIQDTKEGSYEIDDPELERYNFRVQFNKTVNGVSAIFRILDSRNNVASINSIGFDEKTRNKLIDLTQKSAGLVLITGPTGSGKTTTLYSLLKLIDPLKTAIHTVENPVEYELGAWNQHEISRKEEVGKTEGDKWQVYFKGLLRNDIDVGLLGEVRDKSTADAALQLSNTGHLVWTTLHTNSAGRAITRLSEMGVNMGAFADVALAIVAQRLVKKLCTYCKVKEKDEIAYKTAEETYLVIEESADLMSDEEKMRWTDIIGYNVFADLEEGSKSKVETIEAIKNSIDLYTVAGCDHCGNGGFKGRKAVYEVLSVNKKNRGLIATGATGDTVMETVPITERMWGVGLEAILKGETTLNELKRRVNKDD